MDFAVITSPFALESVRRSKMHLALAHLALRSQEYRDFYHKERINGSYVILDNGAAEAEMPRLTDLVHVVNYIMPQEVVLPDVLYDGKATIVASIVGSEMFERFATYKYMVVPQGHDWAEWDDCLDALLMNINVHAIGLAKHLETLPGGRSRAVRYIRRKYAPTYAIHLLGTWAHPFAEITEAMNADMDIRSVDTSAPFAAAQHGEFVYDTNKYDPDFTKGVDDVKFRINIERISRWTTIGLMARVRTEVKNGTATS